jgi:hypothetical protein
MEFSIVLVGLVAAVAGWLRAAGDRDKTHARLTQANKKVRTLEEFYISVTGKPAVFNDEGKLVRRG